MTVDAEAGMVGGPLQRSVEAGFGARVEGEVRNIATT